MNPRPDRLERAMAPAAVALYLALGLAYVFWGRLNGDEGWYALASRAVMAGKLPYRDFLFTQTPLLPYVYGPLLALAGPSILAGRLLSLAFGALAVWIVVRICARLGGTLAGLAAGLLLAGNLSFVADIALLRTQALTVLLTSAALAFLAARPPRPAGALAALSLAAAARLSMLPALALVWAYLVLRAGGRRRRVLALVAANALALAALAVLLYRVGGENVVFGVLQFHTEYFHGQRVPGEYAAFVRQVLANQGLLMLLALAGGGVLLAGLARSRAGGSPASVRELGGESGALGRDRRPLELGLLALAAWLATTAVHASRIAPYAAYQSSNIAFAVVPAALGLGWLGRAWPLRGRRLAGAGLAAAALLGLPFQTYPVDLSGAGSLASLRRARTAIDQVCPERPGTILAFDPALALASGLELLPGYELGQFSVLPWMDSQRAAGLRVVNEARLAEDLMTRRADLVCLIEHDLMICAAGRRLWVNVWRHRLELGYELRAEVPDYGPFRETLAIYRRR